MSEATTKAAPKKSKFFEIANKNFIMLFIAYTIICVAHSMTQATTSAGWKVVGLDMTVIGLISSVMGWAAFIIRPFSAPIVDRGNKKKIYLAAVALFTVAILDVYKRQGQYCDDSIQLPRRRKAFQASRRDDEAAAGGQLCPAKI